MFHDFGLIDIVAAIVIGSVIYGFLFICSDSNVAAK